MFFDGFFIRSTILGAKKWTTFLLFNIMDMEISWIHETMVWFDLRSDSMQVRFSPMLLLVGCGSTIDLFVTVGFFF